MLIFLKYADSSTLVRLAYHPLRVAFYGSVQDRLRLNLWWYLAAQILDSLFNSSMLKGQLTDMISFTRLFPISEIEEAWFPFNSKPDIKTNVNYCRPNNHSSKSKNKNFEKKCSFSGHFDFSSAAVLIKQKTWINSTSKIIYSSLKVRQFWK